MDNKNLTIAGILLILSTILVDIIFFMNTSFTFSVVGAFILGAINIFALHFINVIFNFKFQDEMDFIALTPAVFINSGDKYNGWKLGIIFIKWSLQISLKYKSIANKTI